MCVSARSGGYMQLCRGTSSAAHLTWISAHLFAPMYGGKNALSPTSVEHWLFRINLYRIYAKLNAFETFSKHTSAARQPMGWLGTLSSYQYANMAPLKEYQ